MKEAGFFVSAASDRARGCVARVFYNRRRVSREFPFIQALLDSSLWIHEAIFSEHLFAFLNISCLIEITFPGSIFNPSMDFRVGIKICINFAWDEFNGAGGASWMAFGIREWEMHKTYRSFANYLPRRQCRSVPGRARTWCLQTSACTSVKLNHRNERMFRQIASLVFGIENIYIRLTRGGPSL